MPPIISPIAQELYDALKPLAYNDAASQYALMTFCEAMIGQLQLVEDLVRDTTGFVGWSKAVDADLTPAEFLPWLAQFVGLRIPQGILIADQRALIKAAPGWRRGSAAALRAGIQSYLTGLKRVFLVERDTSAWHFGVTTYTSETPDPAKVLAYITANKPAGLQFTYAALTGQTYNQMLANHPLYSDVNTYYTNYQEARDDQP